MDIPIFFQLLLLFFSVIVHECAHGIMAEKCGDPTARIMGRITLNPLPHIDPVGTILLPIVLLIFRSPFLIGWAKPVPVNPTHFRNYRSDSAKVAFSGAGSNLLLALSFSLMIRTLGKVPGNLFLLHFFTYGVYINLVLAVFNLIPFPPLDGSKIVAAFLPYPAAFKYERIGYISPFIGILVIWLAWPVVQFVVSILFRMLLW